MVEGILTDLQVATVTGERRRDTARERPPNQSETKITALFPPKKTLEFHEFCYEHKTRLYYLDFVAFYHENQTVFMIVHGSCTASTLQRKSNLCIPRKETARPQS